VAAALFLANPVLPLVRAVERIPILAGTMHPNEFYIGVSAMAALITAVAVEDFLGSRRRSVPVWAGLFVSAALLAISGREVWTWLHGGSFATGARAAIGVMISLALFSAAMWAMGARRSRLIACALLLSAGIDYKVFGTGRWFNAQPGDEDANHAAYGIGGVDDEAYRSMARNRQYRVATAEEAGPAPTDYRYWGLATPGGSDPLIPEQYRKAIGRWTPFRTNREFDIDPGNIALLQALGVRFVLARRSSPPEVRLAGNGDFRLLGRGDVFCPVYEYVHAREPFFCEGNGAVRATGWTPEKRDLRVTCPAGCRVILIEQFHSGWRALVDRRALPVERWGGSFRRSRFRRANTR
jgi:hypothetical protein